MPGNVASYGSGLDVLPNQTVSAFAETRTYETVMNGYPDGWAQVRALVTLSRKRFVQERPLTATAMAALLAFYLAHIGQAFYFYDLALTSPIYTYDATGVSTTGRYTVRFDGTWSETMMLGRWHCGVSLVEVV